MVKNMFDRFGPTGPATRHQDLQRDFPLAVLYSSGESISRKSTKRLSVRKCARTKGASVAAILPKSETL
jgi:hypothetical protein